MHQTSPTDVRIELIPIQNNLEKAIDSWTRFCEKTGSSYYVSPGWIRTWCECLRHEKKLYLMTVHRGDKRLYACVLSRSTKWRQGVLPTRLVSVYSSGDLFFDSLVGIYNHFLKFEDNDITIRDIVNNFPLKWDEFYFPGSSTSTFPGSDFASYDKSLTIYDYSKPAYYVDLTRIGNTLESYLATLSQNTRAQIRRSIRYYEQFGPLTVEAAPTADSAKTMLNDLYPFSDARKESKGVENAINPFFKTFHDKLIDARFAHNEIQMLKISAGDQLIGYIYNHVYKGVVHFYQCGFVYHPDNKIRPGLVAHALAILHNVRQGNVVYDFGGGEDRYKKSLSNGENTLVWVRLLRATPKMRTFKILKSLKEQTRELLASRRTA